MNRLALYFSILFLTTLQAQDWPQFLGPTRNGIAGDIKLAAEWPKEGPPLLWERKVGAGFSGPVVANGNLILFHREADDEVVECIDAASGKTRWRTAYPTAYVDQFGFDPGPRATPAIADGKVFTFGAEGTLHGLDLATGKKLWVVQVQKVFRPAKSFFGIASSPLVEGRTLLVNIGGENGAGIAAFDTATGKTIWKATDDEASYSSPVAATLDGKRHALFLTRNKFYSLDPANGTVRFQLDWAPTVRASVSAAAPLVVGDSVFITASYGAGAAALTVKGGTFEKLWSSDEILTSQYASCVERGGFLYGLHGRVDTGPAPALRCVELKTGKLRWSRDAFGGASLILAGDQLLLVSDKGECVRVAATPDGFKESGRTQILGLGQRSHPALADGRLFARDTKRLICVDLRSAKVHQR
ncbi:MAG: alcohol dehydrogenase [Pedosphaera sp.]|nr:alcohol dehydrogenase [Pedosphaera sp.]